MGDTKLLARFHSFCEYYRAEYAFEGVVKGFDTIEIVDPDRLTRGMFLTTESGTKHVPFDSKRRPNVTIGDTVVVVGLDSYRDKDTTEPAVILNSSNRNILFSRDITVKPKHSVLLWYLPMIIGFCMIMMALLHIAPQQYWIFVFVPGWLFFSCWPCTVTYFDGYSRRPRSYHCDEPTWDLLVKEITSKFGSTLSV